MAETLEEMKHGIERFHILPGGDEIFVIVHVTIKKTSAITAGSVRTYVNSRLGPETDVTIATVMENNITLNIRDVNLEKLKQLAGEF